jgi:selenide, water dikinase
VLPPELQLWQRVLLTDPQTSGGLLIACTAERAASIRSEIEAAGYPCARIIGSLSSGEPAVRII